MLVAALFAQGVVQYMNQLLGSAAKSFVLRGAMVRGSQRCMAGDTRLKG